MKMLLFLTPVLAIAALACGGGDQLTSTPAPTMPDPTATFEFPDFQATLERTVCNGTCPIYAVTVRGDGSVLYEGREYVAVTGERSSTVSQDTVAELVEKVRDIHYFSLDDKYPCFAVDVPFAFTDISLAGRQRSVSNCYFSEAPPELKELENLIDRLTNSAQWIDD